MNEEICFKDAALISKISFDDPLANAVKMTRLDDTRVRVVSRVFATALIKSYQ